MAKVVKSILAILDESKGYESALLSTFNFEIDFFDKAILSRLTKNNIKKISVFVDSKELSKAVSVSSSASLGQRYIVNPVEMQGSFHPKVILLTGEKKARLILGSGNLKLSGYYINNEVFGYIDYDPDHLENRKVIYDAIRFFQGCNQFTPGLDAALLEDIKKLPYYRTAPENDLVHFIENQEVSVIDQIKEYIKEEVGTIRIAVPYFDNELNGLEALHNTWPNAKCELFLQCKRSTYSHDPDTKMVVSKKVFDGVHPDGEDNGNDHFYHGKVFLFRTELSDYVLFGSSNCTGSAIAKSKADGGNYECNFLIKGERGKYENFFSQFILTDKPADGHPMVHTKIDPGCFYFKYGVLENKLTLHIGVTKQLQHVTFKYHEESVPWRRVNGEICAEIDSDKIASGIIDLEAEYYGTKEIIQCWYIDRQAIELYRLQDFSTDRLVDKEDFGEGDDHREEYELLLQKMGTCKEDWIATQQKVMPFLAAKEDEEGAEQAGDSDFEEDDFIINVELTSDDDYSAFRQYKVMESIRNRMTIKYMHSLPLFFRSADASESAICERKDEQIQGTSTGSFTPDKRFRRFVKRVVRNILEPENIKACSVEHYLGLVSVLFIIFNNPKNELLFEKAYLIKVRCYLMESLLSKIDSERENQREIIAKIIDVLIFNHTITKDFESTETRDKCEQLNRQLLLCLENKYHLRNCYQDFFIMDDRLPATQAEKMRKEAVDYLEQLYGYQDLEQIEISLKKRYGDLSTVSIFETKAKVEIVSEKPELFFKPDLKVMRDLLRYSSNINAISVIEMTIKNPKPQTGSSIEKIVHSFSLLYHRWSYTIFRANGQSRSFPSSYLSI